MVLVQARVSFKNIIIIANSNKLVNPICYWQPINFFKMLVSNTFSISKIEAVANAFVLGNLEFIFWVWVPCTESIVKVRLNNFVTHHVPSLWFKYLSCLYKNLNLLFTLVNTLTAISLPEIVLSRRHPRYSNDGYCFNITSLRFGEREKWR